MDHKSLEIRSQELQAKFEELLEGGQVYYNPPPSVRMSYDAIVFTRSGIGNTFANNAVYMQRFEYEVTVITRDPDADIVLKVSQLPMCSHNRQFVSDNLYHNVFKLLY